VNICTISIIRNVVSQCYTRIGDNVDIVTGRCGEVHNWAVWRVDT